MASFTTQFSFFFLLVLLFLSPQIQAREGKFFSFFTHFKTKNNVVKEHDKAESPTPTQEPILAPTQEPSSAPEYGSTGPAPEPEFLDNGEGYGLYGSDHSTQYPQSEETPTSSSTTTNFGNQLLNQDFNEKSYKTGFPQTNFHNNNQEYKNGDNNQEYTKNYNSQEYKKSVNNEGYTKNYNSEEYKNSGNNEEYNTKNYNRETEEYSNNNGNGNEYYNNNNNNNYGNGYEGKREGMSDTRFMENGKYYHNVNSENDQKNYKLNGYESGSNENYGEFQNEFDTMEEYEKQQEAQGYTYTP